MTCNLCSYPSESIVESMGSVLKNVREVCGGSKTSTKKKDVTLIRTVILGNLIGTYVDNCQHAILCSLLLMHCFQCRPIYVLSSYDRYARLITLTLQSWALERFFLRDFSKFFPREGQKW